MLAGSKTKLLLFDYFKLQLDGTQVTILELYNIQALLHKIISNIGWLISDK